jgi:hypothetical protein
MLIKGKVRPKGFLVFGLIEDGPVEPLQPPMTLLHITKYLSVSMPLPGPIRFPHQPSGPATCASPVSAWAIRTAFDFSALSSP